MNRTEATSRCWAEIDLNEICGNYLRARERKGGAGESGAARPLPRNPGRLGGRGLALGSSTRRNFCPLHNNLRF